MVWESDLRLLLERADRDLNPHQGRLRPPRNSHDLTMAVRQGHPHFVVDSHKELKVAVVGLGHNESIDAVARKVAGTLRYLPIPMNVVSLRSVIVEPPEGGEIPVRPVATGVVLQAKHATNADLVVLVTDGACGWPGELINKTVLCVLGGTDAPHFVRHRVVRIPVASPQKSLD